MSRRKKPPKAVYLKWYDPATEHPGWFEMDDPKEVDRLEPAIAESLGWILKENKDFITIISSKIQADGLGSCDVTIPKKLIITRLEIDLDENERTSGKRRNS
jgi:hypothetical protein